MDTSYNLKVIRSKPKNTDEYAAAKKELESEMYSYWETAYYLRGTNVARICNRLGNLIKDELE